MHHLKGIVQIKILLSFSHPHVIPNLYGIMVFKIYAMHLQNRCQL